MKNQTEEPIYDDEGINLADPADSRGQKTRYISELQAEALRRILRPDGSPAADVGCGFGRMTSLIAEIGFQPVVGIDPSQRVIEYARKKFPTMEFRVGSLPDLPLHQGEVSILFLLNVARSLHLMGNLEVVRGAAKALERGGRLVVLDNLRYGRSEFVPEPEMLSLLEREGFVLKRRSAIRRSRWPWIYLVRYGLFPERWHSCLVAFELWIMQFFQGTPRGQYANVVWLFEKH